MLTNAINIDNIIENIVSYKGTIESRYIDKFNKEAILKLIEDQNRLNVIREKFRLFEPGGLDLLSFIRTFLIVLTHEQDETLYLTIGLIDLFRDICESLDLNETVREKDLNSYIVENYLNRSRLPHKVPTKKLPPQKKFQEETHAIRDIDTEAPLVFGETSKGIKRLVPSKSVSDHVSHHNKSVKKACFGSTANRIFTLDNFANSIFVFNIQCELEKTLCPKGYADKKEIITDLAWSNRQNRIGVTLSDLTLSFWDLTDNFEFEKSFSIVKDASEYQTNIWYIDYLNVWITTDKTCTITAWDILKESKIFSVSSKKMQSIITNIIPIDVLKIVLVASLDNKLTLLDLKKGHVYNQIDLSAGGINSFCWSSTYQVLLTAGWERGIKLWRIDKADFDVTEIGLLIGHTSVVTTMTAIEETPMVISADDLGNVKVWDIRNLFCLQTIKLKLKGSIKQMVDVYSQGKLGLVANRFHCIEFDSINNSKQTKEQEEVIPLHVEYYLGSEEIIVCTKKDVRFVDLETGRVKKIFQGLLPNENDEIAAFRLIQKARKFIIGDNKGELMLYDCASGEMLQKLVSHSNEIMNLRIDHTNNLLISSSWDSTLQVQKIGKGTSELKKNFKNLHYKKEVSLVEVSVFHSLIVTASSDNFLYIWDYEFGKLFGIVEGEAGIEFTCLQFINGYLVLIAGETTGKLHFLHLNRKDTCITFQNLASIDLEKDSNKNKKKDDSYIPEFATKILMNFDTQEAKEDYGNVKMYISTNKGCVKSYHLTPIFKSEMIKLGTHANLKSNYNPESITTEDFLTVIKTHVLTPFKLEPSQGETNLAQSIEEGLCENFKAHKNILTTLSFIPLSTKKLLTSSMDGFVKIWTTKGFLLASSKINQPLPLVWNLLDEAGVVKYKRKVLCAIKLIDTILKKYSQEITPKEEEYISLRNFLSTLAPSTKRKARWQRDTRSLIPNIPITDDTKKVIVMTDEYSARDLNYERNKELYKKDFEGPSLKEQELMKKLPGMLSAAKQLQNEEQQRDDERYRRKAQRFVKDDQSQNAKNAFAEFIYKDNSQPLTLEKELTAQTLKLSEKLDKITRISIPKVRASRASRIQPIYMTGIDKFTPTEQLPPSATRLKSHETSIHSVSPISKKERNLTLGIDDSNKIKKKLFNIGAIAPDSVKSSESIFKAPSTSRQSVLGLDQLNFAKLSPNRGNNPSISISGSRFAKSTERTDFYTYAAQKLSINNDEMIPSTSFLQNVSISTSNKANGPERNLQKKNFHSILNKLNSDVKKAHFSPGSYSHIKTRALNLNSIMEPATPASGIFSSKVSTKTTNNDTPQERLNFAIELSSLKKKTEETWHLDMNESERRNKYIEELNIPTIIMRNEFMKDEGYKVHYYPARRNVKKERQITDFERLEDIFGNEEIFTQKLGANIVRSPVKAFTFANKNIEQTND